MKPQERYHLTKDGLERVKEELEILKKRRIEEINGEGPRSFSFGNVEPEFLTFREEMAQLDKQIAELEEVLVNYELIKPPLKSERNKIYLGALVTVQVDGQKDELLITSSFEANPALGKISDECAVGRSFLGHKVGDAIEVNSSVKTIYKILKIEYKI